MKWLKKITIAVVVMIGLTIVASIVHHYQLRMKENNLRAELKARGVLQDVVELLPPAIPSEQNSAETIRKFAVLLAADKSLLATNYGSSMKMIAPGKAMVTWQQPDVRDYNETNSWKDITDAVDQNNNAFELLYGIIDKPNFDFQIQYDKGAAYLVFTNLYFIETKKAALWLETATLCDLHRGNIGSAVKNLRAMLALVKGMRDERLAICELIRMAILNMAAAVNWEVLQSPNLTEEQLAKLQNDWTGLELIRQYENTLAMEQACGEITLNKWRSDSGMENFLDLEQEAEAKMGISDETPSGLAKAKERFDIFRWRYWWSYSDEMRALDGFEVLMRTAPRAETNGLYLKACQEQQAQLDALGFTNSENQFSFAFGEFDLHSVMSSSVITLGNVFDRVMRADSADHVVVTAIALKRFQLKHGNYPEKLSELTPEFFAAVPLDPVDGQPLRYRRNADGTFLLYSVGENGVDDGGDPSLPPQSSGASPYWQSPKARDWVWPQPATPDEIQKYYADQAAKAK